MSVKFIKDFLHIALIIDNVIIGKLDDLVIRVLKSCISGKANALLISLKDQNVFSLKLSFFLDFRRFFTYYLIYDHSI